MLLLILTTWSFLNKFSFKLTHRLKGGGVSSTTALKDFFKRQLVVLMERGQYDPDREIDRYLVYNLRCVDFQFTSLLLHIQQLKT